MKYKILIFIITYKASFRVIDVIKKLPLKYLKQHNYQIYVSRSEERRVGERV